MELKKPFYIKSTDDYTLYHPDTEEILTSRVSTSKRRVVVGQYKSEEEMQKKSIELFGEEAIPKKVS